MLHYVKEKTILGLNDAQQDNYKLGYMNHLLVAAGGCIATLEAAPRYRSGTCQQKLARSWSYRLLLTQPWPHDRRVSWGLIPT